MLPLNHHILRRALWMDCFAAARPRLTTTATTTNVRLLSTSSLSRSTDLTSVAYSTTTPPAASPNHSPEAIVELSNAVFGRGNNHLKNVETLTSLPEGLHSFPEVCFIGKPNCGKSSLISCLLHNVRLGKGSSTAGGTRLLQFFNVGDALLLVDTPGYGGWKGRKVPQLLKERANAFSILFRYLALRSGANLKRVYWLMEASARGSVSFQARDEEVLAFLMRERIPFSVVLTKIDRHWRHHAEQLRRTAMVDKHGMLVAAPVQPEGAPPAAPVPPPEDGIARNVQEIFGFLGTDEVPVLAVSANRKQPGRSRNLEDLQHDLMHYCVQDLQPGEPLTFKHLHQLSYAPPTAERIQEVQLRYPVEAFVVPENNNLSLARMVEQHEAMKQQFMTRNVSAARMTAHDAAACHLVSTAQEEDTLEHEAWQRVCIEEVRAATTLLMEGARQEPDGHLKGAPLDTLPPLVNAERLGHGSSSNSGVVSRWREPVPAELQPSTARRPQQRAPRTFQERPSLRQQSELAASSLRSNWSEVLDEIKEEADETSNMDDEEEVGPHTADTTAHLAILNDALPPSPAATKLVTDTHTAVLHAPPTTSLSLPTLMDPHAHYVTAIDGTKIPRSMISSSIEELSVTKEDEMAHFATQSGAGAYEELLLLDQEGDIASEVFTEASDFARLSEVAQEELRDAVAYRHRSAARKQEERFLARYVEKKRKARSIHLHAQGYMCPWVGASEGRQVVQGLSAGHTAGKSGAVLRGLKQNGFGGRSYSARTMKGRGRATKKTGSWAA